MDTDRKIYVIFNTSEFTKEDIVKDIKEEGFPYKFFFADGKNIMDYIKFADEVWTWGDVSESADYHVAKGLGCDLWEMG